MMERLLKDGIDLDACARSGCSPTAMLISATRHGNVDVVSLLLEYGAEKWINDSDGHFPTTPLHFAIGQKQTDIARLLLDNGADANGLVPGLREMLLHGAIRDRYIEGVDLLLQHNADISAVDGQGQTPLHRAARDGELEAVRKLLKKGANMDARDETGWTPVHRAAWNGNGDIVDFLRKAGADMDATTDDRLKVADFLANDTGNSQ